MHLPTSPCISTGPFRDYEIHGRLLIKQKSNCSQWWIDTPSLCSPKGVFGGYKIHKKSCRKKNPSANNGDTPLHFASQEVRLGIVKYIAVGLENKNLARNKGTTPLHSAAYEGKLEIVKYVAFHSKIKNLTRNDGLTPLHFAALQVN